MNININKDDSNINDFLFCWDTFGGRPNKVTIHYNYTLNEFLDKIETFINVNNFTEIISKGNDDYIVNTKSLYKITDDIYLSFVSLNENTKEEDSIISDVIYLYKNLDDLKKIDDLIETFKECEIVIEPEAPEDTNTFILSFTENIIIEPVKFESEIDNVDLYYNIETFKNINKLNKFIKKSNKGLSIIHGEKGTGKTSIINYLANKTGKDIIYIPNNMIDLTINNPSFIFSLKGYKDSIIFIDDCEVVFDDFISKQNNTLNNILQVIDGLQSDDISLNFVLSYNSDIKEINEEFMESNNLLSVIEFKELSADESNNLCEHLSIKGKYKNKTKLIDIIKNRKQSKIKNLGF